MSILLENVECSTVAIPDEVKRDAKAHVTAKETLSVLPATEPQWARPEQRPREGRV